MTGERYFGDLLPKTGSIGVGAHRFEDGTSMRYTIDTASHNTYALLARCDRDGCTHNYIATKSEFEEAVKSKVPLGSSSCLDCFTIASKRSEVLGGHDAARFLTGLAPKTRGEEKDENSVQTEEESKIGKNNDLLDKILTIFRDGTCEALMKEKIELVSTVMIPKFNEQGLPTGKEPLTQTTYMCLRGDLIPELVVWDPKFIIIASRKSVKIDDVKDFMYRNVVKSTKISAGLGYSFASPTGIALKGPEAFAKVFSNGEPMTDASGAGLTFNFGMVQTYAELTIKAQRRLLEEIGGYEINKFPRE